MVKSVEVVNITVEGEGLPLGTSVDNIVITEEINSLPTAQVSLHDISGKVEVKQALDTDAIAKLATLQGQSIAGTAQEAKLTITITGDKEAEGVYFFSGIPLGPAMTISDAVYENKLTLINNMTRINQYRPYIYMPCSQKIGSELSDQETVPLAADLTSADGGNFAQRVIQILDDRMTNFEQKAYSSQWYDPATAAFVGAVHSKNKEVFDLIKAIASASLEPTYETFDQAISNNPAAAIYLKRSINAALVEHISGCRNNFVGSWITFLNAFQLYYVPPVMADPNNPYGKVRPLRTFVQTDDVQDIEISPSYIGFSSSESNIEPIQQVMITGVPKTFTGEQLENTKEPCVMPDLNYQTYLVFPEEANNSANAMTMPVPNWIPDFTLSKCEMGANAKTEEDYVDITRYIASKDSISSKITKIYEEGFAKLLQEYAANLYYDMVLAPYVVIAKVPFNPSWKVGQVYRVTIPEKNLSFTGFLSKATHTLQIARANSGDASSVLIFSHVRLNGGS